MGYYLILLGTFAGALFFLLNGPLWVAAKLSTKVPVFARGAEAPRWLEKVVTTASRVWGIVAMLFWLMTVSQGNILHGFLLGIIFAASAFFVLKGPIWLATRPTSVRDWKAPLWLQHVIRLIGIASALGGFYIVFLLSLEGFG